MQRNTEGGKMPTSIKQWSKNVCDLRKPVGCPSLSLIWVYLKYLLSLRKDTGCFPDFPMSPATIIIFYIQFYFTFTKFHSCGRTTLIYAQEGRQLKNNFLFLPGSLAFPVVHHIECHGGRGMDFLTHSVSQTEGLQQVLPGTRGWRECKKNSAIPISPRTLK